VKKSGAATSYTTDDTPKSFSRLLAFSKTGRGQARALDDGVRGVKRKRVDVAQAQSTKPDNDGDDQDNNDDADNTRKSLQIQPGEQLADFSRRVDQTLPLAGLSTKGKKVEGVKDRQTKHGKRLRRMQEQWREEEAKIREKEEEEQEEAEGEWEEQLARLDKESRQIMVSSGKVGKKNKRKAKALGEIDEKEGDPWAVLNQKREAPKGVFDVVQAPPKFEKVPRQIFKVHDVPKDAGSLRRREVLGETRADIIKSYRSMMAVKRS
jgi:hypothetical protein